MRVFGLKRHTYFTCFVVGKGGQVRDADTFDAKARAKGYKAVAVIIWRSTGVCALPV